MACFCSEEKPAQVNTKNKSRAAVGGALLAMDGNPNEFAIPMKEAPCKEPLCCCLSCCCAGGGCTACWARKEVLEKVGGGMDSFVMFQGYVGTICCCIQPAECCPGSPLGLCIEGWCCPMLSLSIARLHMMNLLHLRPDPVDYQLIQCSNCLQCLSCLCNLAACLTNNEAIDNLAELIDLIADCVTLSVAGCMGAQVKAQMAAVSTPQGGPMPAVMER